MMMNELGYLAYQYGGENLPIQVLSSNAGWYIGTVDQDGWPFTRESEEYWPTREMAERALKERAWTQKGGL